MGDPLPYSLAVQVCVVATSFVLDLIADRASLAEEELQSPSQPNLLDELMP